MYWSAFPFGVVRRFFTTSFFAPWWEPKLEGLDILFDRGLLIGDELVRSIVPFGLEDVKLYILSGASVAASSDGSLLTLLLGDNGDGFGDAFPLVKRSAIVLCCGTSSESGVSVIFLLADLA